MPNWLIFDLTMTWFQLAVALTKWVAIIVPENMSVKGSKETWAGYKCCLRHVAIASAWLTILILKSLQVLRAQGKYLITSTPHPLKQFFLFPSYFIFLNSALGKWRENVYFTSINKWGCFQHLINYNTCNLNPTLLIIFYKLTIWSCQYSTIFHHWYF